MSFRSGLLALLAILASPALPANENQPWIADQPKYLLLDRRVFAEGQQVSLQLGPVTKHPANPLMVEDRPWELRYDNLYPNVAYDPATRRYLCWYNPFAKWGAVEAIKRGEHKKEDFWKVHESGQYKGWETVVCLAVSDDGLKWEKPELGLYDFRGSKANNVVAPVNSPGIHGTGVFLDAQETDPARRFKLFTRVSGDRPVGVAASPDGIHWPPAQPGIPPQRLHGDTHNNALWAPTLGKYVGFTRMIDSNYGGRIVYRTESDDFRTWTLPEMVLHGDMARQTYAMLPCHDSGIYVAMLMIYDKEQDRTFCELAWSPDTRVWHRVRPGTPFIPNGGREGDYDWGCVYSAQPLLLEDEIRLYYGGSNARHFAWREGCLALATLRRDRWAGYRTGSPDQPGSVTTNAVLCRGAKLTLSADAAQGSVRVSVLGSDGNPVAVSEPVKGDVTDHPVPFPEADRLKLEGLVGKPVRLRFELEAATLYAFGFGSGQ